MCFATALQGGPELESLQHISHVVTSLSQLVSQSLPGIRMSFSFGFRQTSMSSGFPVQWQQDSLLGCPRVAAVTRHTCGAAAPHEQAPLEGAPQGRQAHLEQQAQHHAGLQQSKVLTQAITGALDEGHKLQPIPNPLHRARSLSGHS